MDSISVVFGSVWFPISTKLPKFLAIIKASKKDDKVEFNGLS